MAYNDYSMGGYIPGDYETEEDRRRRMLAEQAQAQAQDQESGGITAERPSLGDLASQYIGKRVDAAQQRLTDAGQIISDPAAAMQRRMGMPEQPVEPTPVKQTITTDPATGEQKMTISGSVQDLSAANPLTPTVTGPAVPTVERETAQPPAAQAQQMAPPPAVPNIPQGLVAGGGVPERPDIGQVPTPGPATQVAGPVNPATPAGEQVASYKHPSEIPENRAPVVQQAPAAAPGASLAQMGQAVIDAHNEKDPAKRQAAMINILATGDEASKQMAKNFIAEDYMKEKKVREAEKQIDEMTPTDAARYLKDRNKDGSYVKAILFARLGLTDLARQEQEKLSPSLSMSSEIGEDGQRYSVVRDSQGAITKAFDSSGKETNSKTLASLNATAIGTKGIGQAGATRVRDSEGREWSVVPTTRGSQFFDNSGKPGVPTGKTVPITVGGDVGLQRELAVNRARIALEGKKGAEAISVLGDLNKKNQAEGLPTVSYDDIGMNDKGEFVARPGAGGTAATTVTAGIPTFKDPSIEIISAQRPAAEQQAMYDAAKPDLSKDPSGQTRYNTAGNPVARPGTSAHEGPTGNAFDVNAKKLTRAGRAELASQGYYQPIPQQDPNHWERLPGQGAPAGTTATSVAEVTRQREQASALSKEERSNFLTYEEKDIIPRADASATISRIRKQQLKGPDGILNNPEIVGIMSGQGGAGAELANLIRDTVTGGISNDELSRRVNSLGLTQRQKDLVYNQLQLNNTIAPETLKANAGAGSVSDAEQRANKQANIDITRVPLYTAATMLHRDQFEKDVNVARQAFRSANPNIGTVREFNDAWGREKERLQGEYDRIYEARARYIGKYYQDGKNPLAITEAYKQFPVPEFSRDGGWNYGTDYARKAARKPLDSFNR